MKALCNECLSGPLHGGALLMVDDIVNMSMNMTMNIERIAARVSSALLAGTTGAPVHAQPALPALHPAGVEFSLGVGRGRVPDRGANQFGISLTAMLAWHARTTDGNRDGLQVAVSATQHTSFWGICADGLYRIHLVHNAE